MSALMDRRLVRSTITASELQASDTIVALTAESWTVWYVKTLDDGRIEICSSCRRFTVAATTRFVVERYS